MTELRAFLKAIRSVVGPGKRISLHEPEFSDKEKVYLEECLRTTLVSSIGPFVDRFENLLADFVGAPHAIATVNGTSALTVACRIAGVQRDDEVLMPALSFVAPANALSFLGAIPHFVEAETHSLGIDASALALYLKEIARPGPNGLMNTRTGKRIAALVVVHAMGHAANLDPLVELCENFKLPLIEDAAESLGTWYKGKHTGTFGLLSAFSFNGNKVATCGGGGAIVTNKDSLARHARHLATTAKQPHAWEFFHDEIGYNFRMPNLNAALGVAQLESLPGKLERKRLLASRYREALGDLDFLSFLNEPSFSKSNYWLNAILLKPTHETWKEQLLQSAHEDGLLLRPLWKPLHTLPMYENAPRMALDVTESLSRRLINLPSSAFLGHAQ